MSFRSSGSHDSPLPSTGDIIRSGVLKKAKTGRKKYFVLRAETADALARLEYYDSEKKYRAGSPPKRCIHLKTCFNINKKQDSKHKHVIALYTKDDCFGVAFESDEVLKVWLKDFLTLQHGVEIAEGETLKPKFEFVWQVELCERGLGAGRTGFYRLCLTDKIITLLKIDEPIPTMIQLSLANVRSCGNLKNFFFLEVGRMSEIGAGEIWFEAADTNIALNIQTTVSHRFKLAQERSKAAAAGTAGSNEPADLQPKGRIRSASDTDSSKTNSKKFNPVTTSRQIPLHGFRERCDSMPSRPRTTSEGNHCGKPYSVHYRSHLRDASHSPPAGSPISPPSDSTGSSYSLADDHDGTHEMEHQRLYSTMTPDEVIAEEDYPESPKTNHNQPHYVPMTPQNASEYMVMLPPDEAHNFTSNSASSMSSVTSGTPSTDNRYQDYHLDKVISFLPPDDDDTRPCRAYSVGSKPPEAQLATTPENARVRAFSVGSKNNRKYFNRVLQPHHHIPGIKSSSAPLLGPPRMGSSHGSINNPMDDLMMMDFSENSTRWRSGNASSGDARSCNHKNSSCNGARGKSFLGFLFGFGSSNDHKKTVHDGYVEMKPGGRTTSGSSDVSPYVDMTQGRRLIADLEKTAASLGPFTAASQRSDAYLDMSGNAGHNNPPLTSNPLAPYLDMSGGQQRQQQAVNHNEPYLDMSAGSGATAAAREDYMDMTGTSPARASPKFSNPMDDYARQVRRPQGLNENLRHHDYLEMSRFRANSNSSTNSRGAVSPGTLSNDPLGDYLDMTGRSRRADSFGSHMSTSPPHFDNVSPKFTSSLGEYAKTSGRHATDVEGYVEMTPGHVSSTQHQRQSSTDSADTEHGDYLNMSGMNVALSAAKTDQTRSQPIAIQTSSGNTAVKNSSPISISSLLGRKPSPPTRGSPKMHLPLSPYSSLPRQKSPRKGSAAQGGSSKDSSLSSSVTTTPSSSSTMFPMSLNTPQSPESGSKGATPTTGVPAAVKVPVSVLNVPYKTTATRKKTSSEDYTMMDFESTTKSPCESNSMEDTPYYMNYCPPGGISRLSPPPDNDTEDYSADYAVMKPGVSLVKPATLPRTKNGSSSGMTSPLANHLSSVGISDRQNMCFMPIREKDERMASPKPGDVPDRLTQEEKALETASMDCEDSPTYNRLKSPNGTSASKIARPSSSNSDLISVQAAQRPASTTGSEKGTSRPSSVCSEGLASRLGLSSSVYSSSSSTSTVVGVPELTSSNPEPQQQIVRLHYASLDLTAPDPSEDRSPRNLSDSSLNENQSTTFVYADIDFIRSEELSRTNGTNGPVLSSGGNSSNSAAVN